MFESLRGRGYKIFVFRKLLDKNTACSYKWCMDEKQKSSAKSWEILMQALLKEILAGKYAADKPLPGEYPLCEKFGCSRTTVRRAMVELEKKGLVYRRHGKGTFVHSVDAMQLKPVGLLIKEPQKLAGDYFVELIRGCNSYLHSLGSQITIISQSPSQWSRELFSSLSGVIVVPAEVTDEDIKVFKERDFPYVVIMESQLLGPKVNMDVEQISYDLTKLLLDKGHRKIALISGNFEHTDRFKRNGIAKALGEYGISLKDVDDIAANYDSSKASLAAEALIKKKDRPTAIIGFDDMIAIEVIKAARKAGLKLPSQLSVVGYNNTPMGSLIDPPLTTVHFPVHDAGRAAARMIAGYNLKNIKVKTIIQQPHLVNRKSISVKRSKK